jgi:adenylate kinase
MRYKTILLFGAPGSGKGTQGKILGNIPGFFHCATGDIFRSLDLSSETGKIFWDYSSRGELVPDEIVVQVWRQFVKGMELINQFYPETQFMVLDGLPRSVRQAQLLQDSIEVVKIIYLQADQKKMVERLRRRALKENRIDDASDEVIVNRLAVFERDTRPVLEFYPPELTIKVDASLSMIRVLSHIIRELVPLKETQDGSRTLRI